MKMNFIFKLFCLQNLLVLSTGLKYSQTCKAGVPWLQSYYYWFTDRVTTA